jgi:hypothetical protein
MSLFLIYKALSAMKLMSQTIIVFIPSKSVWEKSRSKAFLSLRILSLVKVLRFYYASIFIRIPCYYIAFFFLLPFSERSSISTACDKERKKLLKLDWAITTDNTQK